MLGVNLLVRLGRSLLAGPVADSGVLPAGCYRHLALAALEEENFPGALAHLKWAQDPLLTQVTVLRLRLLAARHRRQRQALQDLLQSSPAAEQRGKYHSLLNEEERALELLAKYEKLALDLLRDNLSDCLVRQVVNGAWGCQGCWFFTIAFRMVRSLRIQAMRATFFALPLISKR